MVSGTVGFAPNPVDGLIFFFEPSRGIAATILHNTDELTSPPMRHTLFAMAAVLLLSAVMLSLAGWAGQAAAQALRQRRRDGRMTNGRRPRAAVIARPRCLRHEGDGLAPE